jgi:hypothetical protein
MQGHNHERATGIAADNDQEIGRLSCEVLLDRKLGEAATRPLI